MYSVCLCEVHWILIVCCPAVCSLATALQPATVRPAPGPDWVRSGLRSEAQMLQGASKGSKKLQGAFRGSRASRLTLKGGSRASIGIQKLKGLKGPPEAQGPQGGLRRLKAPGLKGGSMASRELHRLLQRGKACAKGARQARSTSKTLNKL